MREFLRRIIHALEAEQSVELVTILSSSGSTPRGAGAMLAVFPGGGSAGTVGGGNVEYEAQLLAQSLLAEGRCALRAFRFRQGDAASLGMVCGGEVTLHFQFLPAGDEAVVAVFRDLLSASAGDLDTWLLRRFDGEAVAAMGTADRAGARHTDPPETLPALLGHKAALLGDWQAIPIVRAGKAYIFGGGHVSQALVPILASAGFRPVVFDDREEFASPALFPQAEKLLWGPFGRLSDYLRITEEDYVVIMTRGHQADYEVLRQTLRSGARYLGCIGSKGKLALCQDKLLASGFTAEEYARLHAPIGLAIGAETPAEIAVAVAAEMIAVRAGVPGI